MAAQVHWFARDIGDAWASEELSRLVVSQQLVLLGDRLRQARQRPGSAAAEVIELVDAAGHSVGTAPKLDAHQPPGRLHRAFSVLLHDEQDRLLLQRRADSKYHFAGLWTNSCCGHPAPGTDLVEQARTRCFQELGIAPELTVAGQFTYRAVDPVSGLVEHELDVVLTGRLGNQRLAPDPAEVSATRLISADDLRQEMASQPGDFTPWLLEAAAIVLGGPG